MSEKRCPTCAGGLERVRQGQYSQLNSEQFDAIKAGDYYCSVCPPLEGRGSSGLRYWWESELEQSPVGPTEAERLTAELTQLREDLARAEGEREEWLKTVQEMTVLTLEGSAAIAKLSSHPAVAKLCMVLREKEATEQERDTLKAECERLKGDVSEEEVSADLMNAIAEALGDAHDCTRVWHAWNVGTMTQDDFVLVAEDWERLREIGAAVISVGTPKEARLRAQLTQTEEARKLCAVQMMGLEEEREKLAGEVGQLKQGMWQMKDAEIARWKNSYENMRDFAVKSGLDIVCDTHGSAESSTLPRTYGQGAEDTRERTVRAIVEWSLNGSGLALTDIIRALPTKEG